ncbi:MAG: Molybdopterin synthase catalytic subunit [Gammaproteobacteria bacterium]|nr:Molybdopterin synthase catalytic subunit [Gammaproteobacteria bacterium]
MKILLTDRPFDPWREIQARQQERFARPGEYGATAVFVGTMRDFNEGDAVRAMSLTHYEGMTERHLQRIASEAAGRWPIDDVLVVHRTGALAPGDPIVAVAVWSAHRAAAFDACRYIMEDLKSRAPFWKKETLPEGERWVERNTPG